MTTTGEPVQAPAFTDTAACRDWLAHAPLTDVVTVQALFLREINLLNRYEVAAAERLDILEALRDAVGETQDAFGRKFAGKPLPLTAPERAAFDACRALWHGLATGYMRCADACFAGDPAMKPKAALIFQRALAALAAEQLDTHRAGISPPAEHWRALHQLYAAAEQLGVAEREVVDAQRLNKMPGSPAAAYVEALLLAAAGLHEHGQRQIAWISRWARRWAAKVKVTAVAPAAATQAFPLCVDLASNRPAGYVPASNENVRWLDGIELKRSLKKRLQLLAQGEAPAKLNLGSDCVQPACEQLLKDVYQRWCKGGTHRGVERRPGSGACRFIAGAEAIHYYLSGRKPFKPPSASDIDLLRREAEEIATFGRVATHRDEHHSEEQGFAVEEWKLLENWHMVDASTTGLRISRPAGQGSVRIVPRQLIATCPADAESFLLGCVHWALVSESLELGVTVFPGRPEPVALRGTGPAATGEKYRPAFLLPAVPALGQEASVVMAVGSFKLGKLVEAYSQRAQLLRLTRLIERGADFERAAYEPA